MTCVFVQVRCKPGTTYQVADAIHLLEVHSELYSTSGDWDLLIKIYVPEGQHIGRYVNENFAGIESIERTLTTIAFRAF